MPKSVSDGWVLHESGDEFTVWQQDMRRVITRLHRPDTLDELADQRGIARLIAAAPLLHSVLSRAAKHGDDFSANDWKAFVLEAQAALSLATTPTDAPKEQEK